MLPEFFFTGWEASTVPRPIVRCFGSGGGGGGIDPDLDEVGGPRHTVRCFGSGGGGGGGALPEVERDFTATESSTPCDSRAKRTDFS